MSLDFGVGLSLGRSIGSGYFGTVYEASDQIHGRIAVKVFDSADPNATDPWAERKKNLLTEGQRLKDAEHPNIVRVYHLHESTNGCSVALAMEFCDGGSLGPIYESGPMSLHQLRDVLSDAALGLQAIHARGMLHRDIKPSNILLHSSRAKVGDFGLVTANILYGYASGQGYVDHLAPEVHMYGLTSIQTDIWAFGMTIYRLLHGKAFYDEIPLARYEVANGGYANRLPWLPHVPDEWRRLVRSCLNDDSHNRLQGAGELLTFIGKLPISPDWGCEYHNGQVVWNRLKGGREIEVVWNRPSPRKQTWFAVSQGVGGGNNRRLASSNVNLTGKGAERELRDFFRKSR